MTRRRTVSTLAATIILLLAQRIPLTSAQLRGGLGNGIPQSNDQILDNGILPGDVRLLRRRGGGGGVLFDLDLNVEHDMTRRKRRMDTTDDQQQQVQQTSIDYNTMVVLNDKPNASPEI